MIQIKPNVYSVGASDKDIRIFHGYATPYGSTYNAFLVVDEEVTLIDTVKAKFTSVLLENIKAVLGSRKIDNLICNHVEPDHSGALPQIIECYPDIKVYGTANCIKELKIYYPESSFNSVTVKLGDSLITGKNEFDFYPMPMVHWPDSMSTFLKTENILFSNDAFGQHFGTDAVYDSDISLETLLERAGDYYANIVLPFGAQVVSLIKLLSPLKIKYICPSHGVLLFSRVKEMIDCYVKWSANVLDETKGVIVFDTMWGTTKKMAEKLRDEYREKNIDLELINLSDYHYSYAIAKLLSSKYIFVGSPCLNNNMMPSVAAFLTYMKGLKPKARTGKAFGSYGWSGESVPMINDFLCSMGFTMLDPYKVNWNF